MGTIKSVPQRFRRRVSLSRRKVPLSVAPEVRRKLIRMAKDAMDLATMVKSTVRPTDRLLFIGRGMRPVFDAYAQSTPHFSLNRRRQVRFFTTPPHANLKATHDLQYTIASLQRMKVVPARPSRFVIVDRYFVGNTFRVLKRAIQTLSPGSEVVLWRDIVPPRSLAEVDMLLEEVDRHPRPTVKDEYGLNDGPVNDVARKEYLYLTRAISRFTQQAKKKKN